MNSPLPSRWLALPLAVLLSGGAVNASEPGNPGTLPAPLPLSRYQEMIEKSPFAPATAAPAPTVEAPSFAKEYYITGMAQLGGKPFVTLSSRDQQKRLALFEGSSAEGITLASVEWASEVGKSKATLKKGSEFGVVSFDEAAMQPAPIPTPVPQQAQAAPFPVPGRGGGNFGYGDRQRRRPMTNVDRNSPEWQERRRAWMERMRAEGRNFEATMRGNGGERGGAEWRNRPSAIPAAPR